MIHAPSAPILAAPAACAAAAFLLLATAAGRARADEPPPPPPTPGTASPGGPTAAPSPPAPAFAPSDHDAVVGHWGIEARRIVASPYPLALSSPLACPTGSATTPCTVDMGAVSVRYWKSRNFAWNLGLAFALGGGRQAGQALDTYVGVGPIGGLTLLLANWRHLAIGASPEASVIYFKPGGSSIPSTKLIAFRAELEAELHFGFVDVPALSVGITTGLVFQYQSAPAASTWSVSVSEPRSIWGTLTNLFIRYYL